jgi:23S rRNA (cytidine1920-2'-O)/16S rRNA (cytidine1409-2'-O)-methyltransferase
MASLQPARRLDVFLVEAGFFDSRARAQAAIAAGEVCVDGVIATRASQKIMDSQKLSVTPEAQSYVSRGSLKLAHALTYFDISPNGQSVIDLGASTGGFTDVLLRRGAKTVYAIDVGHDQLHASLQRDARVVNREGVNARSLDQTHIPEPADAVVCDVSFISLRLVVEPALALLHAPAWMVLLIKPQFEAGRAALNKKGVVTDPHIHERVCAEFSDWFAAVAPAWKQLGITPSPITGPEGNHEFLFAARLALE